MLRLHWLDKDYVAVIIIQDHDVQASFGRLDGEASCLVSEDASRGFERFSWVKDGSEDVVSFAVDVWISGCCCGFGAPYMHACLVEVAFGCGDGVRQVSLYQLGCQVWPSCEVVVFMALIQVLLAGLKAAAWRN